MVGNHVRKYAEIAHPDVGRYERVVREARIGLFVEGSTGVGDSVAFDQAFEPRVLNNGVALGMGVEIKVAHEDFWTFEPFDRRNDLLRLLYAVGMVALSKIADPHAVQIHQMNPVAKGRNEHLSAVGAFVSFGKRDSRVIEIDGTFKVRTDSERTPYERGNTVVIAIEIRETVFKIGKEFTKNPHRIAYFVRIENRIKLVVAGVAHHFLETKRVDLAPQAFDEFENGGIHPPSPDVKGDSFHVLFSVTVRRKNDFNVRKHFVDRFPRVDMVYPTALVRPGGKKGERILIKYVNAFGDGFRVVVVALYELLSGIGRKIALEIAWEGFAGRRVDTTSGKAADGFFAVEVKKDDKVFGENSVEKGFLIGASGDSVENDSTAFVRVAVMTKNGSDEFGRNELSRVEARFHLGALFVADGGEVSKFLPHFKKGTLEFFEDFSGLCALAGSLYSDEEDMHGKETLRRARSAGRSSKLEAFQKSALSER